MTRAVCCLLVGGSVPVLGTPQSYVRVFCPLCGIQLLDQLGRPTRICNTHRPLGTPTHPSTSSRMSDRISGSEKPVEVVGVAVDLEGAANTQVWEALGDGFMQGDQGETVELSSLRGEGKVIGLYFSAHW